MNIGIIVAMRKEQDLFLPLLQNRETKELDNYTFHVGSIGAHNIIVMQCGIGKVNAAIGTTCLIKNFDINLIINTGVAGGADKNINVMDIVVGAKIAHHDIWCGEGTTYGQAEKCPLFFESNPDITKLIADDAPNIKKGLICSGDKFIASIEEVNEINSNFPGTLAVDMESASIAQVCYLFNIPFFCIRVISDSPGAGHNNTVEYSDFWEDAPTHTFRVVKELLLKIN